jgi:YfiH family protein
MQINVERAKLKNDWQLKELNDLTIIESPLLAGVHNLVHAFTTRLGGISKEPLNWFNLGRHMDDDESRQDAMQNRKKLCESLALDLKKLRVPGQKHTTNIFTVNSSEDNFNQDLSGIDGLLTELPKHPLLLHFADCVPIILFDTKKKVLAVLHAGWRGTASGIASNAIDLFTKIGSEPEDIVAAIGPFIGMCCYQVGDDVAYKLASSTDHAGELINWRHEKPYPDLGAINALQLMNKGLEKIDVTNWCTSCHPEIFYSHRYGQGKTGRQGAIAAIL